MAWVSLGTTFLGLFCRSLWEPRGLLAPYVSPACPSSLGSSLGRVSDPAEPCPQWGWRPAELLGRSCGTSRVIGRTGEGPRPIPRSASDLLSLHPKCVSVHSLI